MNLNLFDPKNIRTVTDLRHDPDKVLTFAGKADAPVIVFERSTPRGAIVSMEFLEAIQEKLEDLEDACTLSHSILTSKKSDFIPLSEFKKKYLDD